MSDVIAFIVYICAALVGLWVLFCCGVAVYVVIADALKRSDR